MAPFTPFQFIRGQLETPAPVERTDLSGKTVLVVGANAGIGLEASKHFASMKPARLIIGCRDKTKGEQALKTIEKETKFQAELWLVDLSKFSSVVEFAERFETEGIHLDLAVLNAGVARFDYQETPDGLESTLQVNHFSTALLAILLLPVTIKAANQPQSTPRIVVVSSDVHYWYKFEKSVVDSSSLLEQFIKSDRGMDKRYFLSKLLNVFFVRAFNGHLSSDVPVTVDTVNPGFCDTGIRREIKFPMSLFTSIMDATLARTAEEGSRQLVWAAIGNQDQEKKMKGAFIQSAQIREPSDYVISEEGQKVQERLWNETIEYLSKVSPKVRPVVDRYLGGIATGLGA